MTTLVLLLNIGTPKSCSIRDVGSYLSEFLNDPRVIDLPWFFRTILVNGCIVPFRKRRSLKAYQKIWQAEGSPLFINMKKIQKKLEERLGDDVQVEIGMRYGEPSIESVLSDLKKVKKIVVFPQFPQYASSSTGSSVERVLSILKKNWNIPSIHIVRDFYDDEGFIEASADRVRETLHEKEIDALIMSYHGVPMRHLEKSRCSSLCSFDAMCPVISDENAFCYRAQCFHTSMLIAKQLNLPKEKYRVAFQSRIGKLPWTTPDIEHVLVSLIREGKKNIAVMCPSFVADCLETLEEIKLRACERWKALGGEAFYFISCVNDHTKWIDAMAKRVMKGD